MQTLSIIMVIFGALMATGLIWVGVLWLLALTCGWRALARRFEADRDPPGKYYSMASGGLGWTRFNGVLRVWVSDKGLGLGCLMPAMRAMPTLLLPWRAITAVEQRKGVFVSTVRIEVDDWSSWITLRGAAGDAALGAWQAHRAK